ncbi:hypothetical protein [Methanobacterium formicicum]|uniref:Uncharacterized protein n=1 Tax=Methanobacterium formicicum (strain DSM 3637 / PP1) TaxID=1204725 RepID=K2R2Y0_METFP|nr:hypothetical protein [Methanobacterium formicicum]EKF86863.1 hypothetical protein A994_01215 [Methanobacterium formicicum DSM 3637]
MAKRKSKIKLGVTCQCKKPAVPRSSSVLRKVQCKKCGIIFSTNRDENSDEGDICFKCRKRTE